LEASEKKAQYSHLCAQKGTWTYRLVTGGSVVFIGPPPGAAAGNKNAFRGETEG